MGVKAFFWPAGWRSEAAGPGEAQHFFLYINICL